MMEREFGQRQRRGANMKILSVDRFDGPFAICEDDCGNMFAIDIAELPNDTKSGDILVISDAGEIVVDQNKTKMRKDKINKLQDELWS